VGVNDVRPVAGQQAQTEVRPGAGQGGETLGVIRPIAPVLVGVGAARSGEEVRRVKDEQIQSCGRPAQQMSWSAEQVGIGVGEFGLAKGLDDGGIARNERPTQREARRLHRPGRRS